MRRLFVILTLGLLIAASGTISPPSRAANGDLDRSFGGYGTGGRVISEPFPGTSIADSVATPDEKLIVVGSDGQDIVVVRYDAGGKLDPAFGTNGITILNFDNRIDTASAVAITYNAQNILVAGTTTSGPADSPNADFAVARLNADGKPDTAFSLDGKTTVDFNGRADRATAVDEFVENKILVGGSVEQNPSGNQDFGFALLNNDGSPVPIFGNGGKSQHDFGGNDTPLTVFLSSNTIYAAGYRRLGTTSEYVISLHNYGNGKLLNSFNGTGYRIGATPPRATGLLAVGSFGDEDVVAMGKVGGDFGLLRFKADGNPVTTWGDAGLVTADFGGDDTPHTLSYLPERTIAVAGVSGTRLAMARFTDGGQLVPNTAVTADLADTGAASVRALTMAHIPDVRLWTIGAIKVGDTERLAMTRHFLAGLPDAGGQQTTDFGDTQLSGLGSNNDRARAAVFQPDGKLLVAGRSAPMSDPAFAALARYTPTGALDPTFDGDGQLSLETILRGATDIALQPDGKIVVAGDSFNVTRLNPSGSPDASFNGTGKATFNIPNSVSEAVVIQPDGKIVLAGYVSNPATFVVARFTAAGAPDPGFGLDGVQRIGIGLQSLAFDIAIQPDGKLVVAGVTAASQTEINSALARLNVDGSPDTSFDGDGKLTTDFGSVDVAASVVIQPDGAILAGGYSANNGAAFARYRPADGALDPTFDGDGKQLLQITGGDQVRALALSDTGITAALCDANENAGLVVRLTPNGQPDPSINRNGRLPFRFGGTDCPFGLASETGRIAAVGYARNVRPDPGYNTLSEDFAVAMYENVVAPPPSPTTTATVQPPTPTAPVPPLTPTAPVPPPTPTAPVPPTPGPPPPAAGNRVFLPLVLRA